MNDSKGRNTRNEIFQQPKVWKKTFEIVSGRRTEILDFFQGFAPTDADVILTGAGTSAFIGKAVHGLRIPYQKNPGRNIPTTELLTHPEFYLQTERPTLLVSFARSGNSPESLAVVELLDKYCPKVFHLIITCDETGKLYAMTDNERSLRVLLPPETNDVSLAMTSSFSSMMLAYILITKLDQLEQEEENVARLARWGEVILTHYSEAIAHIAAKGFDRAVFLGAGPLVGVAEESHLKLQELTDGQVMCAYNSFLGFRHGPRAIVNGKTLLVYLFSDDDYSRKYEFDLVRQINQSEKGMAQVAVSHLPLKIDQIDFDLTVTFGNDGDIAAVHEYLGVAEVLVAQLMGYFKSLSLGLNPDQPSVSGTISRVVQGVKIYPI
ncbi:SIS domain-containing protein [Thermophagus sp. OGC60D27]|uniref:SIS domain-containing protein n=1 Tax=Thermophagus sp. OGC60D27 TaxID=3458415 RepID=UPI004037E71A